MPKIDLMGIGVNTEKSGEILEIVEDRFKSGQKTFIVTPYSEFFVYSATDYKFRKALQAADLSLPDGISVLWLAYYLHLPLKAKNYYLKIIQAFWQLVYSNFFILFYPAKIQSVIPEKITGSDFFWNLIELANRKKMKIFLLGGHGQTPELVAKKILQKFPELEIQFSNLDPEQNGSITLINNFKPSLLFVAYGPVKQELWIAENLDKLQTNIAIGVGGTFDYIAGVKKAPPRGLRKVGLEWLYRLITQGRVKRIWTATFIFLRGALRHKVLSSMPYRENVLGVIINQENKVFVASRNPADPYNKEKFGSGPEQHWQFPQGGVDAGEMKDAAVLREITEETGISAAQLAILGQSKQQYSYVWQHIFRPLLSRTKRFKGQRQSIYFLKFSGDPQQIKLDNHEFNHFKWVAKDQLSQTIHPVRREMLKIVLQEIDNYLIHA